MKKRIRNNKLHSTMNVVPYIDVMLVLLIIFMVTAPMFTPGIINLPKVGKANQVTTKPIEIIVNKEGQYRINNQGKTYQANNIEDLISKIVPFANSDTQIVVSGDKDVTYDKVINVIDKLYTSGIRKVGLTVKEHD